jgi:hypothetical protein
MRLGIEAIDDRKGVIVARDDCGRNRPRSFPSVSYAMIS